MICDSKEEGFFTLENLEKLKTWHDQGSSADFSGNVRKAMRIDAKRREIVQRCEIGCIERGLIKLTDEQIENNRRFQEHKMLEARLDAEFPNARSKEIVEFEDKKYRRCFTPGKKSNSGKTVTEWIKSWVEVKTI